MRLPIELSKANPRSRWKGIYHQSIVYPLLGSGRKRKAGWQEVVALGKEN